MNFATAVVALILIIITAVIVTRWIMSKKNGKTTCSGNCTGCAMSGMCEDKKGDNF